MGTPSATAPPDVEEPTLDGLIEQDPHRSGRHNARLVGYGTHVWAVIAYLQGADWDTARTAAAYDIPEEAVQAAIRYYERHRALIDAHLLLMDESHNQ